MGAEPQLFERFGREFPAGTVLFREGEPGREMYVIQEGKVNIPKRAGEIEKLLSALGPGEFFGEMSILSGAPRSATATCAEDSRLLVIDARPFESMVRGTADTGFILSGENTMSGVVTIAPGARLRVGGKSGLTVSDNSVQNVNAGIIGGTLGTAIITNHGNLTFMRTDAHIVANAIHGTGNLRIGGALAGAEGHS